MRLPILCAVLVFLTTTARADEKTDKGLIGTGAAMVTLGAISMIAGGVLAATNGQRGNELSCTGACSDDTIVGVGAGITLLSVGAMHAVAGIPMVGVGAARQARRKSMTLSAAMAPTQGGATAALTLRW